MVKKENYNIFVVSGGAPTPFLRETMEKVKARGLAITLDYLDFPQTTSVAESAQRAVLFEKAAARSDELLVFLGDPDAPNFTAALMIGIGIALGKRVLVVITYPQRENNRLASSSFSCHPNVTLYTTVDAAIEALPHFA